MRRMEGLESKVQEFRVPGSGFRARMPALRAKGCSECLPVVPVGVSGFGGQVCCIMLISLKAIGLNVQARFMP